MSIVFTPKIAFHFASGKAAPKVKTVPREVKMWAERDIALLVALRALGMPYKECAAIIGHSSSSCIAVIGSRNLYAAIMDKRTAHIAEAMK